MIPASGLLETSWPGRPPLPQHRSPGGTPRPASGIPGPDEASGRCRTGGRRSVPSWLHWRWCRLSGIPPRLHYAHYSIDTKATVFVGGGLFSVVHDQIPIRWGEVGPLGSPTPTLGRANQGTPENIASRPRLTRDASLPSRLGGSNNGNLWCLLYRDLDGPRADRTGDCIDSHHSNGHG